MKQSLFFIGAGQHATRNIFPAAQIAGAFIAGVSTRHLETAQKAVDRFGGTGIAYDNYQAMLENLACHNVVVVAQAEDAFRIVKDCLTHGKNVFTDKPLGLSVAQAQEVAALAKENDALLMVGYMKRHAPCYQKLYDIIQKGDLGAVHSFRAVFAIDGSAWCQSKEQFAYAVTIHFLDLISHLFGEVLEIQGMETHEHNGGFSQVLSLRCEKDVVGSVAFENRFAWNREYESLDVTFSDGFVRAEDLQRVTVHKAHDLSPVPWQDLAFHDQVFLPFAGPSSGVERDLYLRGFVGEMAHFLHCCEQKTHPTPNGEDNVSTTMVCARMLETLKRKGEK